jgi:hypothetical protein
MGNIERVDTQQREAERVDTQQREAAQQEQSGADSNTAAELQLRIEQHKLEQQKLDLERQKIELERYKLQRDDSYKRNQLDLERDRLALEKQKMELSSPKLQTNRTEDLRSEQLAFEEAAGAEAGVHDWEADPRYDNTADFRAANPALRRMSTDRVRLIAEDIQRDEEGQQEQGRAPARGDGADAGTGANAVAEAETEDHN